MSEAIPKETREFVVSRALGKCEYFQTPQKYCPDPFSVEHVCPRSRSGSDDESNLAFSCGGCNGHKFTAIAAVDPHSGLFVAVYNPRKDVWSMHFQWSESRLEIVGTSATGRATVVRLKLNREYVVNLRRLLLKLDSLQEPGRD